jgi:hypothetical protein
MLSFLPFALAAVAALPTPSRPSAQAADAACVALVLPAVEGVEDATAVATSVRAIFQSYLTGPSLKSVLLEARLASQAGEEAKQKDCVKMLTVTVTRKAAGNGRSKLGALASAAGTTAAYIPLPNYGTAAAVGAARGSAEAVSYLAYGTHAKDEMTLGYKVTTADGATLVPQKSEKAKAKSDGEDLLTPLISRAAEAVAAVVTRR